jgi:glycosyltransferase involved in cell wall biosynthesis
VGDGPGRPVLEATRDRLRLGDRLRLVGRVPHADVPLWMNLFDAALSTQTDDPVGWGRTTAKLPEYLACGTPVVCTDVGEAHRWLSESRQTLPYRGLRDDSYPQRLAEHLRALVGRNLEPLRSHNRALALRHFDYQVLRRQAHAFLGEGGH